MLSLPWSRGGGHPPAGRRRPEQQPSLLRHHASDRDPPLRANFHGSVPPALLPGRQVRK